MDGSESRPVNYPLTFVSTFWPASQNAAGYALGPLSKVTWQRCAASRCHVALQLLTEVQAAALMQCQLNMAVQLEQVLAAC